MGMFLTILRMRCEAVWAGYRSIGVLPGVVLANWLTRVLLLLVTC